MKIQMNAHRPPLWLVLIVFLSYAFVFYHSLNNDTYVVRSDSDGYLALSETLFEHQRFSQDKGEPFGPEIFRIPGYPLFLSFFHATRNHFSIAILVQSIMGPLLLFLAWPLFFRLGGKWGGITGSIFLTLDLVVLFHSTLIMTEMLFLFFVFLGVKFSVQYIENRNFKNAIFAGLFWTIASAVKPIAIFMPAIVFLVTIKNWKSALLFITIAYIFPFSWMMRNLVVIGEPLLTVQGGEAMLRYPAASALAIKEGRTREDVVQDILRDLEVQYPNIEQDVVQKNRLFNQKASTIMKENWVYVAQYCAFGTARILGGTGLEMILELLKIDRPVDESENSRLTGHGTLSLVRQYPVMGFVLFSYILFLLTMYGLFFWGTYKLFSVKKWDLAIFLFLSVFALIMISNHQGYYRFRIPLIPLLATGAAAAFIKNRTEGQLNER